jgi:hypothetical protein
LDEDFLTNYGEGFLAAWEREFPTRDAIGKIEDKRKEQRLGGVRRFCCGLVAFGRGGNGGTGNRLSREEELYVARKKLTKAVQVVLSR